MGLWCGVGSADPRLGLAGDREAVVQVTADADVQQPATLGDLVLHIQGNLFDVSLAVPMIEASAASKVIGQKDRIEGRVGLQAEEGT